MGSMTRFSQEKLRSLYGSPEHYRKEYDASVSRLADRGVDRRRRGRRVADARAAQVSF